MKAASAIWLSPPLAPLGPAHARRDSGLCRRRLGGDRPRRHLRGAVALGEIAPKGKVQATAGFTFTPDHRRWGEFHARLSRMPRPGSSVMLQVGDQPFLLVTRERLGVEPRPAAGAGDHRRAARCDGDARRSARRGRARASSIPISLDGAPTAIDAAAARCAFAALAKSS